MRTLRILIAAGFTSAALVVTSCAATAPHASHRAGHGEVGTASYYGAQHEGRPTASGVAYRADRLTAAHRTLPFGTHVRVTNLENQRSVVVVINDRGPFKDGRVIDVSKRAARELGFLGAGTARVRLEIVRG